MINISIQEQRKLLDARLSVEPLTSNKNNKALIQTFHADSKGKGLERFLKEDAWNEDIHGSTKVYLVKDIKNNEIVFFFALSAGLLYKEIGADDTILSGSEKEIVDICIEYFFDKTTSLTTDEVLSWYDDSDIDKDKLRRVIDRRIKVKLVARDDPEVSDNRINIKLVSETFPGIVLTHFCKNSNYHFSEQLSFPIGFYVFWEIIIKQVLHIASILGCQYLYLFAADHTDLPQTQPSVIYTNDWDDDDSETVPVYKLVEYYKNELKFEDVQDVTILKPYYDFQCFSLFQEIHSLPEHRNAGWIQHSDVDT